MESWTQGGIKISLCGNPRDIFGHFAPNSGILDDENEKIRVFPNNLQGFPVSPRISWEPGSQVPRKYPTLAPRGYNNNIIIIKGLFSK